MKYLKLTAVWFLISGACWAGGGDYPFCQILDRPEDAVWRVMAGVVNKAPIELEGVEDLSVTEFHANGGLLYYQTDLGDFDLRAASDVSFLLGGGGYELPDQVGDAKLQFQWITRTAGGQAIRIDVNPGLYSDWEDISGKDLFIPFGVAFIQAFNEQLSVVAGSEFYPDFRRDFDPRLGLRWSPVEMLTLDLMYPESRLMLAPNLEWELYLGARFTKDLEYQLDDNDPRARMLYREDRLYGGINWCFADDLKVFAQAGNVMNRSIDYRREQEGVDIENAFFFQVGLGSVL